MNRLQLFISAAGCAGQLALALVALRRTAQSRLALPLAFLFLDVFTWNLASLLGELSPHPAWRWIDHSASPLTAPLALEFLLAFAGRQRAFPRLRAPCWAAFALLALAPTAGLFITSVGQWDQSGPWAAALALCAIPVMSFAAVILVLHLREASDPHERARTRLLFAALALGTTLGLTDLMSNFIRGMPSLGALGFLGAGALTFVAATRERLLESEESAATALAIGAGSVVAYLAIFQFAASRMSLLLLGTALVTLASVAVIRHFAHLSAARRGRTLQLATLGRFAAQMAHDVKNPLAALKGAAQFLKEDLAGGETKQARFVDLMLEQIDRLQGAIDGYQRLARVELLRANVQINDLVREVVALQPFASGVAVRTELGEGLPPCNADSGLLGHALQNLIKNGCEAIGGEGSVTVRTARSGDSEPPGVVLSVEDTGAGMDARTQEHAFDEFFTTKAGGSGLGLSYVRRVVEAHGGGVSIASRQGRGTVVRIRLPLE